MVKLSMVKAKSSTHRDFMDGHSEILTAYMYTLIPGTANQTLSTQYQGMYVVMQKK